MAGKLWECVIYQEWATKTMVNVLFGRDESGSLDDGEVADAFEAAWVASASIADIVQTTDISYVATKVRNITDDLDGVLRDWQNATGAGQVATETAPPSVALCYTFRTGIAGRSNRGRAFIGGVTHGLYASEQVQWNLSASPGTSIKNAFDAFGAELTSNGLNHHVYSRKLGTDHLITSYVARPGLASQRPRANRYALP